jgi:hypothetical protein
MDIQNESKNDYSVIIWILIIIIVVFIIFGIENKNENFMNYAPVNFGGNNCNYPLLNYLNCDIDERIPTPNSDFGIGPGGVVTDQLLADDGQGDIAGA